MSARKVKWAQLHEAFRAPGEGRLSTLDRNLNTKNHPGIVMFLTDTDLEVAYDGRSFAIPKANVAGVLFEIVKPDDTKATKNSI